MRTLLPPRSDITAAFLCPASYSSGERGILVSAMRCSEVPMPTAKVLADLNENDNTVRGIPCAKHG